MQSEAAYASPLSLAGVLAGILYVARAHARKGIVWPVWSYAGGYYDARTIFDNFSFAGGLTLDDYVPLKQGRCVACTFTPRNIEADSTEQDLVLVFALGVPLSSEGFVRSLRSTGCRATIAVIADRVAVKTLRPGQLALFEACGCKVFDAGPIAGEMGWAFFIFRHVLAYFFLKDRMNLFRRALVCDLYDTVFQGDPFCSLVTHDFVGISGESVPCDQRQKACARWLTGRRSLPWWIETPCKNAGVFIGGVSQLVVFFEVYLAYVRARPQRIVKGCDYVDQVIHNILIHDGSYEEHGVNVKVFNMSSVFWAMNGVWNKQKVVYRIGEYRLFENGPYPLVLHMFDRSRRFCMSVREACAPVFDPGEQQRCKMLRWIG
jgi:hypothetical protein